MRARAHARVSLLVLIFDVVFARVHHLYVGGSKANGLTPFDAPTSAWKTPLNQWQYQDGKGNVFVSDNGKSCYLP